MVKTYRRTGLTAAAALLFGLAGAALSTQAAMAGADDGGTKAFYAIPGPGAYQLAPQTAPAATPNYGYGNDARATMNSGAYESYRTPVTPHRRHHIPVR